MRTILLIALFCALLITPVFAADTQESTAKRLSTLENSVQGQREDLGTVKIELDTTKDDIMQALQMEAAARKKLEERLDAEVAARGESDKLIAELRTALASQKIALQTQIDLLQAALDKAKTEQAATNAALNASIAKNNKQDKKDRTISYVMGLLLGAGIAFSK